MSEFGKPEAGWMISVAKVLSFGFILFYYSEILFWARLRPGDDVLGMVMGWLAYSFVGWIVLGVMEHFRVRTFAAVFLAGSLFGWLIEGVLVQTVYEDIPLSISFTGLAWHALISVGGGWFLLRRALRWKPGNMAFLSIGIGLVYGFWAISWWVQEPAQIFSTGSFLLYSLFSTGLLLFAYRTLERVDYIHIVVRRRTAVFQVFIVILLFSIGSALVEPISLIVFPLLMLAVFLPLRRFRQAQPELHPGDLFSRRIRPVNYLLLMLIPAFAALVYWMAQTAGVRFWSHAVVYTITTPAGFYLFARSIRMCCRLPSKDSGERPDRQQLG